MWFAGTMLALAWGMQALRFFIGSFDPLYVVMLEATLYTSIIFGLAHLPAYPLWVVFRRRPGLLAALAGFLCLCWSVVSLGIHF
jgi:hypothetical protein